MERLRTFLLLVAFVALVYTTNLAISTSHEAKHEASALKTNVTNQRLNRAENVESWCDGINASRDYDRAFVNRVTHGLVVYGLADLPCERLIAQTLHSTESSTSAQEQLRNHPVVARLAK